MIFAGSAGIFRRGKKSWRIGPDIPGRLSPKKHMAHVLTSWKEIAQYLGKGVRTVQRWEHEMGLPVRRPKPKERHIVLALCEELDGWVRSNSHGFQPPQSRREEVRRMKQLVARMVEQTHEMHEKVGEISERAARHGRQTNPTSLGTNTTDPRPRRTALRSTGRPKRVQEE